MSNIPPPADPARFVGLTTNESLCTVIRDDVVVQLTEREFQMLKLLMAQPIVTTGQFADLSQRADSIGDETVRGHVASMRRKLKPIGLGIEARRGKGFVLFEA